MGRTKSITTETVRTLPDGSNIIETKTTNISRSNSRKNSLLASSEQQLAAYNLKKIEEDLSDFDYTYLDHVPQREVALPPVTEAPRAGRGISPELRGVSPSLSPDRKLQTSLPNADYRANSMTSSLSTRKLKSILKNSPTAANAAAAVAANRQAQAPARFPEISSPQIDALGSPKTQRSPKLEPPPVFKRRASIASGENSIKFDDKVETIPYHNQHHDFGNDDQRKQQEFENNVNLYNRATQAAMEKVYGSPGQAVPQSPASNELQEFAEKKSAKKVKMDEKRSKIAAAGVDKNYVYENHHREFGAKTLRDLLEHPSTTRKERAKEEKKHLKQEEKLHHEQLKAAEKQRKKEEKAQKKQRLFGFLKKRKNSTDHSELSQDTASVHTPPVSDPLPIGFGDPIAAPLEPSPQIGSSEPLEPVPQLQPTAANGSRQLNEPLPESVENVMETTNDGVDSEDVFVDVPDHLMEDDKRVSRIPVLEQEAERWPESEPLNPVHAFSGKSLETHAQAGPEAADSALVAVPENENPTLVGGAAGVPVVMTASTNAVTPARMPDASAAAASEASQAKPLDDNYQMPAPTVAQEFVGAPEEFEDSTTTVASPNSAEVRAEKRKQEETVDGTTGNADDKPIIAPDAEDESILNKKPAEKSKKGSKGSKGSKFKRVIEKYFINTYSR